jgi:exopolysaccharide biosynthesis polyprenyl glycosylphosphotransferase
MITPSIGEEQEQGLSTDKPLHLPGLRVAFQRRKQAVGGAPPASRLSVELMRSADVAVAVTVLVTVFVLTNAEQIGKLDDFLLVRVTVKNLVLLTSFMIAWPVGFALFGLYDAAARASRKSEAVRVAAACSVGCLATVPFLFTTTGAFRISTAIFFWISIFGATLLSRSLLRLRFAPLQTAAPRRVLIVGSGPRALNLFREITSDPLGNLDVVGFVDSTQGMLEWIEQHPLGGLDELENILMNRPIDEVLIALPIKSCYAQIQECIDVCERVGVEAQYLADVFQHTLATPRYGESAAMPLVALKAGPDDIRLVVKRGIDILASAAGLLALAPLLVIIAAAIRLTSPGPALFVQKRYGYKRRLFSMYKFRTMVAGADELQKSLEHLNEVQGPVFKIREDPRITTVGRFLRRTSLDELPQLFNVLRGDMSLVGPRPLPMRDVKNFSEAWLMRRFSVVPGCTCLWQISGRSNLGFDDWVTLDLRYIDRWSLRLDFEILLRTVPAMIRGTGAS